MSLQASAMTLGWPIGRILSLGLALLLIIGAGTLSYRSQQSLVSAGRAADRSREVLYQTERVLSLVKDTGSGVRIHLATGDQEQLEANSSAIASLPEAISVLRTLTTDNPAHRQRIDALESAIDERVAWVDHLLVSGRSQGESVFTPAEIQRGKDLLDRIRAIAAEITVEESQRVRARADAARRQAELIVYPLLAGLFSSLTVIVVLFARMHSEIGRRSRAEAALQDANASLEQRVHDRTEQLEASERRYRNVVDLMQEAVWIHTDGTVTFANPAAAKLFGADHADRLIGRSAMAWVHPDDRERAVSRTRDLTARPCTVPVTEMRLLGVDGKARIAAIHAISFLQDGRMHVMASARDVTELREAEARLHQAQKMESVGQLTGGVAHDFNNLLTVIIGGLDSVVDRAPGDLRPPIDNALKAAERAADLTRQLLAFSRRQVLSPRRLDLNELTEAMKDLLRRTLGEDIEIEMRLHPKLWPAMADRGQVENALLNVTINARDAMPAGGGKLTIETDNVHLDEDYAAHNTEVAPGDYAMLAVTDTGGGMPPEVVARAFEPFFTTKPVGKGTGLGLSMIYGFAKQSSGHLKIYSEVGHGTTVRLYLPRQLAETVEETEPVQSCGDHPGGGESILVVEDDGLVRAFTVSQLRDLGYRVLEAADGPAAQAILDSHERIDVIVTDVVMPGGMTGRQLAQAAQRKRPGLKTLYTSGYTENSIIHQGKLDPGVHFLSKPFRRQELAAKVREVLDVGS